MDLKCLQHSKSLDFLIIRHWWVLCFYDYILPLHSHHDTLLFLYSVCKRYLHVQSLIFWPFRCLALMISFRAPIITLKENHSWLHLYHWCFSGALKAHSSGLVFITMQILKLMPSMTSWRQTHFCRCSSCSSIFCHNKCPLSTPVTADRSHSVMASTPPLIT